MVFLFRDKVFFFDIVYDGIFFLFEYWLCVVFMVGWCVWLCCFIYYIDNDRCIVWNIFWDFFYDIFVSNGVDMELLNCCKLYYIVYFFDWVYCIEVWL